MYWEKKSLSFLSLFPCPKIYLLRTVLRVDGVLNTSKMSCNSCGQEIAVSSRETQLICWTDIIFEESPRGRDRPIRRLVDIGRFPASIAKNSVCRTSQSSILHACRPVYDSDESSQ